MFDFDAMFSVIFCFVRLVVEKVWSNFGCGQSSCFG